MKRKKLGPFEIVLIVILALAITGACCLGLYLVLGPIFNQNGEQPAPAETPTPPGQAGMCLMNGRLLVGTSADYPPFETYTEGFILDGFDIALMKEVAVRMNLPLDFNDITFEGLGGALQLNQINAAISAISVTSERAAEFAFSNVYYVGAGGILAPVNSDQAPITSPDQLVDKRLGVQTGTVYQAWTQANLVDAGKMPAGNLYSYPRIDQAINDLITNKIDLVLLDEGPARKFANQGSAKLVAEGFNQQGYAIGLRPDCAALSDQINTALAQIQNDGTLARLTEQYLDLGSDEIIPLPTAMPPTATPPIAATSTAQPTAGPSATPTRAPGCVDGMTFVRDLTYPDNNMSSPPLIQPGTPFQKGWRLRNSGTCTWNYQYFLTYAGGNSNYSSMGGQPTAIVGTVPPGATYDLYINLVAPAVPGVYQGFWQMTNPRGAAFGERIWVGIQVPPANPATPTPAPNIPQVYRFLVNPTVIQLGQCVQISWETSGNVSAVNIFRNGNPIWVNGPAIGTLQDCPQQSGQVMYEIQASGPGGTAREDQPVTVVDAPPPTATPAPQPPPVISGFQVQPGQIDLGGCVNISWAVQGTVDYVRLARNGQVILDNAANTGNASDCPAQPGSTVYRLEASGAGQTVSDERTVSVNDIPPPPALAGTSWLLTNISDGQGGMQPVISGTQITLYFDASGAIQGVSGCNNYTGSYVADGNAISVMVGSTTQMTCADPAGVMEQENLYLALLQSSSGFNLSGSQLKLYGGMNSPQLMFVSKQR